ncbi:WhiB family transcriptional regulator [Streptomyces yunnanensis]|uniref:WhiB family transcriptional regulator, redox-sensing transcriptional regulator n=1 Tax=Streptomyces yunnanensis TaxID=156453 RepID=A0A9X8QS78_9ACTN|nr:WhiB family transcriptional regulator [Streptomyces yunnanensis]SHL73604.1 WhiB family transcriptional regulator, redox-sensing transcriptional regulator [Streptomyces yunnanensis]
MTGIWQDQALCAQTDPEIFAPDVYNAATTRDAKDICNRCEVRRECLADALAEEGADAIQLRAAVRGGTTPRERHDISRKPAAA